MKVLVAVKRVVDYNVRIQVLPDHSGVDTRHVKMSMNPFDEIALEQAVRLKESGQAGEVVAVCIGDDSSVETLRYALALGADRAILLQSDEGQAIEPLTVAKLLAHVSASEQPDLFLLGKQAIDDDSNQTGQMLAGLLNIAQGAFISELNLDDNGILLTREVDEGSEVLKLTLPAVLTCDLRLNEPRFVKLPNIMKARKKPLERIPLADTGVDVTPHQILLRVTDPASRRPGLRVASVPELVERLRNEAGVIQ